MTILKLSKCRFSFSTIKLSMIHRHPTSSHRLSRREKSAFTRQLRQIFFRLLRFFFFILMRLSLRLVSRRRKLFFISLSLVVVVFLLYQIFFSVRTSILIVSLTTTPKRFQFELPLTIRSLLSQTLLPKEIRIYVSSVFNRTNLTFVDLRSKISSKKLQILFDEIVRLIYVENDDGPATKFLPILREFHSNRKDFSQNQPIVICDDDHIYQTNLLSTLDRYSKVYPNEILGFRGWRSETNLNSSFFFSCLFDFVFSSR